MANHSLVDFHFLEVLGQPNSAALRALVRLDDESLVLVLSAILNRVAEAKRRRMRRSQKEFEAKLLCWEAPCLRKDVVVVRKELQHSVQVSCEEILAADFKHSGKMLELNRQNTSIFDPKLHSH